MAIHKYLLNFEYFSSSFNALLRSFDCDYTHKFFIQTNINVLKKHFVEKLLSFER